MGTESKKKICIVIPEAKNGGAEKQAILLMSALKDDCECYFVILYPNKHKEPDWSIFDLNENCHIIKIEKSGEFSKVVELAKILKKIRPDAVFPYLTKPNFYVSLICRFGGIKHVYTGIRNEQLPWWKFMLEKIANRTSAGIIINNYSGKEKFESRGLRNITVIPNCYPHLRGVTSREQKETVEVVTVGRFVAQKDYETAIKAFSIALQKCPALRYTIIGFGELEGEIRRWIREYGVEEATEVLISPDNIPELLLEADIYLCTSLFEGTSNAIMEAMDASLPIVATDVGDNAMLVNDKENGYILPVGDADGLASAIADLAFSYGLRNQMGAKSVDILGSQYSLPVFRQRYLKIINP